MATTPFLGNTLALANYIESVDKTQINSVGQTDAVSRAGTIITGAMSGSDWDVLNAVKTQIRNLSGTLLTNRPTLQELDDPMNFNQFSMSGVSIAFANNAPAIQQNAAANIMWLAGLYELDFTTYDTTKVELRYVPSNFRPSATITNIDGMYRRSLNAVNTTAATNIIVIPDATPAAIPLPNTMQIKLYSLSARPYFTAVPTGATAQLEVLYNGVNMIPDGTAHNVVAGVNVFTTSVAGPQTAAAIDMSYTVSYQPAMVPNVLAANQLDVSPFSINPLLSKRYQAPLVGVATLALNTLAKTIIRNSAETIGPNANCDMAGLNALTAPNVNVFDPAYLDLVTVAGITLVNPATALHLIFAQQVVKLIMLIRAMGIINQM